MRQGAVKIPGANDETRYKSTFAQGFVAFIQGFGQIGQNRFAPGLQFHFGLHPRPDLQILLPVIQLRAIYAQRYLVVGITIRIA